MNLSEALTMATDIHEDNDCLYVHGRGILLLAPEDNEVASEIIECIKLLSNEVLFLKE